MRRPLCAALSAALVLGFSAGPALAGKGHTATVSPFAEAPTVDGKLADGEWRAATGTVGFQRLRRGSFLDGRLGRTRVGFTRDRLYVAVVSELPPDESLRATKKYRDASVVHDDAVEIWLDPNVAKRAEQGGEAPYYQFIGNSIGTILDVKFDPSAGTPDKGWNGDWAFANTVDEARGVWIAELSIPFAELGWEGETIGRSIGVLVARDFKRPWRQATWFPHEGAFNSWRQYPEIRLTKDAPSVRIESIGGEKVFDGALDLKASVYNPGAARKARVRAKVSSSDMPSVADERVLELPAGKTRTYSFEVSKSRLHADAKHHLALSVASPDGDTTYFDYDLRWTKAPDNAWHVQTGPEPRKAVKLAYYPSYGFVKLKVNTRELADAGKGIQKGSIAIVGPDGKAVLEEKAFSWEGPSIEQRFEVGDLEDGTYTAKIDLAGYGKTLERRFKRQHFVWEGNDLGETNEVYEPFDPIAVDGDEASVVLREHEMSGIGLWSSVTAKDRAVLAGPMRLRAGGEALEGEGSFAKTKPHEAIYEGTASHPAVHVSLKSTLFYDGAMRVAMTLAPGEGGEKLEGLTLDIPIRKEIASLFHVTTTGLRRNPAGSLPEGTGRIWDSTEFPDGDWYGNFKPYAWVGGPERGIAWFADNDKNWVIHRDEKTGAFAPCLSIHRDEDGTVHLRVHFVQEPTRIEKKRKIVFGLMASPAKPMPEDWRRTLFNRSEEGYKTITWMGSTYWGAAQTMKETYPLNRDFSILNKMQEARLTGKVYGKKAFMRAWRDRNLSDYERKGRKSEKQIMSLVEHSLHRGAAAHGPGYQNVYWEEFHSVSRHHPETQVFGNEWSGGYGKGSVHPLAPSYLDFQAWYGAEFVRRGIGLYFDNVFPKRAYDPVTTAAYRLPNGAMQPSANMWRHRAYFERIWRIHKELAPEATKPIMMFHMTNTNIVAYMGFGQSNLDLEWFYGPEPQQSKYPADLLRAQSLGLKTGNIPLALASVKNAESKKQRAFARRTKFGTLMVHEIRFRYRGVAKKLMDPLFAFGYGQEGCRVYNYWDRDAPVETSDERLKWLLLERDGKLLLVLCTWASEPTKPTVRIDTDALDVDLEKAVDAESGKSLGLDDGSVSLELRGYGVRILRFE